MPKNLFWLRATAHSPEQKRVFLQLAKTRPNGITFVELLISGTVVLLLLGGMTIVLTQSSEQLWARTDTQLSSAAAAQRVLDRLAEDLRRARQPVDCSQAAKLTFSAVNGDNILYQCVGCNPTTPGRLERVINAQPPQVIADGLTDLTASCDSNGLVRLRLSTRGINNQGISRTQVFESQVLVRMPAS